MGSDKEAPVDFDDPSMAAGEGSSPGYGCPEVAEVCVM